MMNYLNKMDIYITQKEKWMRKWKMNNKEQEIR